MDMSAKILKCSKQPCQAACISFRRGSAISEDENCPGKPVRLPINKLHIRPIVYNRMWNMTFQESSLLANFSHSYNHWEKADSYTVL